MLWVVQGLVDGVGKIEGGKLKGGKEFVDTHGIKSVAVAVGEVDGIFFIGVSLRC
jgi:hypothetical protein